MPEEIPVEKLYPIFNESDEKGNAVKRAFRDLHTLIEAMCPGGRARSVALTNLEQASMWAVKSIHQ